MKGPVPNIIIKSLFGKRSIPEYKNGEPHFHAGVDIRALMNAPIVAPCACKVIGVGVGGMGEHYINAAAIDEDLSFKFVHCKPVDGIVIGKEIGEGELIAHSDGSGTKAPHLHFATWHGKTVAPPSKCFDPILWMGEHCIGYIINTD